MTCKITLSANAGISLQMDNTKILVDALHDTKTNLFSTVSPTLWEQIKVHPDFADPDFIIYTHCHPDHYSYPMTAEACQLWPQATVVSPENAFKNQILLNQKEHQFFWKGIRFRFFQTPHDGKEYADVKNYAILVSKDDFQILISGDSEIASEKMIAKLNEETIDIAILNFPWITLKKGRECIQSLQPKQLIIHHLPFEEDDLDGFRHAAEKSAAMLSHKNICLLMNPLQHFPLIAERYF